MNKDRTYFTILFIVIVLVDIIGLVWAPSIRVATKPLIVTSLLGYYILKERSRFQHRQHHLFLTGLIFSLLGDIFLNINMEGMFVIGLGAFLITQLLYSSVFFEERRKNLPWTILAVLVLMGLLLNYMLWGFTSGLHWHLGLYSLALIWMVFTAFSRKPGLSGYRYVVLGSVLFLISDSLLAIYQYYTPALWLAVAVMATYASAQYFIVVGYKEKKIESTTRE